MGTLKCDIENYHHEPVRAVLDSLDLDRIRAAAEGNRSLLQKAWQRDSNGVFPVISQTSVRNFYIKEDRCGNQRMLYRDALRLQLMEAEQAIQAGALILPMVLCDFNVLTVSSIFNPDLVASDKLDDANVLPVFKTRRDMEKLEKPDINRGLVPLVLTETKRLRARLPGYISVGVRMNTAPLSLACELRGATELIYDMLEAPDVYHHFLGILTDLYIEVRQKIHEAAGIKLRKGEVHADVSNHTATNGVCVCEDSISLLGPRQFENFAAPYLMRIFDTFGGGTLHSCGATTQVWPAVACMPGWDAFEFGEPGRIDCMAARKAFPGKNLIFYDCGAETKEYMQRMQKLMHEPQTFVYSGNYEHIAQWRNDWHG